MCSIRGVHQNCQLVKAVSIHYLDTINTLEWFYSVQGFSAGMCTWRARMCHIIQGNNHNCRSCRLHRNVCHSVQSFYLTTSSRAGEQWGLKAASRTNSFDRLFLLKHADGLEGKKINLFRVKTKIYSIILLRFFWNHNIRCRLGQRFTYKTGIMWRNLINIDEWDGENFHLQTVLNY